MYIAHFIKAVMLPQDITHSFFFYLNHFLFSHKKLLFRQTVAARMVASPVLASSTDRPHPILLEPGVELCDLTVDAKEPDAYLFVPVTQPCKITIKYQEFNSASRCLLLLSPTDPYPSNETAVWRFSSPDPKKTVVIHPADANFPRSKLYVCIRYLECSGNVFYRITVELEPIFFSSWFSRGCGRPEPSDRASIMSSAGVSPAQTPSLMRLTSPSSFRIDGKRGDTPSTEDPSEFVMGDAASTDFGSTRVRDQDTALTTSALYCGYWRGHLPHGRGMKFYAVNDVAQVILEKMLNASMLLRTEFEQQSIPWSANSLHETFEATISLNGELCDIDVKKHRGWRLIQIVENDTEAYDGYWCDGQKHGKGIYQWQDRSYIGEWKNGKREGSGALEMQSGSWYRGQWANDHRHGKGTFYDVETQIVYTGEWAGGFRHGEGKLEYPNGVVVFGEWEKNKLKPVVRAVFPDGKYEGEWEGDNCHGEGVWVSANGCVSTNKWVNGVRQGPGSISYPNGVVFKGNWVDDIPDDGAYYFANGDVYIGEWDEKLSGREGTGRCVSTNGDVYEGEWHHDLRHGNGKIVYGGGAGTYEGSWMNGVRHGRGVLVDENGVYEGEFSKDERSGLGTQKAPDGSHYTGGWKHGFRAGPGEYYYAPDDTVYEGIFLHDRLQGKGSSKKVSDHDTFEGTWLDGHKHGYGTRIFPNGDVLYGLWHKGDHQNGSIEYTFVDGTKFTGDWRDGQREGHGVQINADGTVYEGMWKNNLPWGHGKLIQLDGTSVECEWENARQLDGKGTLTFVDGSVYNGDIVDGVPEGMGVLTYPDETEFFGRFQKGIYVL